MTINSRTDAFPPGSEDPAANGASAAFRQRDRIRLAAVQLFTRQSYAGTSMKQLASELGMTPANLYNYYASKEAILFEVLSYELESLLRREHAIVDKYDDPSERMGALAYDLVVEDLKNPKAAFVGRHGVNGLTEEGRTEIARLMSQVRTIWITTIDDGVARGVFDVEDVRLSALSALTLCSSTASWYSSAGNMSPEQVADHTAAVVLRILGRSERPTAARSRKSRAVS
ncbi:TetR/AcrR family transcriptional regulator [Blastococcus sp. CT_GayMR20]|uniref:TetR/AcrR family transcriptional regulator n=1 Tax=Blastococcus sp. CT_GayMR20 TaxID=2559609 RepID=UPI0014306254|nr:TetR/AcrR family transcriptional regulator [Blastococcus sp. CT_GayMR20]